MKEHNQLYQNLGIFIVEEEIRNFLATHCNLKLKPDQLLKCVTEIKSKKPHEAIKVTRNNILKNRHMIEGEPICMTIPSYSALFSLDSNKQLISHRLENGQARDNKEGGHKGYGNSSVVKKGGAIQKNQVVKIVNVTHLAEIGGRSEEIVLQQHFREMDIMKANFFKIQYQIYTSISSIKKLYIFMDDMGIDLFFFLQDMEGKGKLNYEIRLNLIIKCIRALMFIHENWIHCDIKIENIMIDQGFWLRVIDYGHAHEKSVKFDERRIKGTLYYFSKKNCVRYYYGEQLEFTQMSDIIALRRTCREIMGDRIIDDKELFLSSIFGNKSIYSFKRKREPKEFHLDDLIDKFGEIDISINFEHFLELRGKCLENELDEEFKDELKLFESKITTFYQSDIRVYNKHLLNVLIDIIIGCAIEEKEPTERFLSSIEYVRLNIISQFEPKDQNTLNMILDNFRCVQSKIETTLKAGQVLHKKY